MVDIGYAFVVILFGGSLQQALVGCVTLRVGIVLNSLVNEWGHICVACAHGRPRDSLTSANLLGNHRLLEHLQALVPLLPDRRGHLFVRIPRLSPKQAQFVRVGGFWVGTSISAMLLLGSARLCSQGGLEQSWASSLLAAYGFGTALAMLGAVWSDLSSRSAFGSSPELMACGNVTIMGSLSKGETLAFPARARTLLLRMLEVSQIRGCQSGGGAVQTHGASEPRQLIRKCLNTKRGDLAQRMTRALVARAGAAPATGNAFLVQTHVRYATSGVSTEHEAHPFRFVEASVRGKRRIMRRRDGAWTIEQRHVETALTHNGDMDGIKWRGQVIKFPDLSYFMEHVLGVPNRWVGDSPLLSAAIELFVTRGQWFDSLRLAYHVIAAPKAPDLTQIPAGLRGSERAAAAQRLLADHPVPDRGTLTRWAEFAEEELLEFCKLDPSGLEDDPEHARDRLVERLVKLAERGEFEAVPAERRRGFARAAIDAFFDNDLYVALRKLEPALLGTFGCVVTSTLEPNTLVTLSRGQPLSIGFQRATNTVAVVSERGSLKVRSALDEQVFEERLDMDFCRGEIARVGIVDGGPIHLTLYGISDGREWTPQDLQLAGRVVSLVDNPYMSPVPAKASDRVDEDLNVLGSLLRTLRASWRDPDSYNQQTGAAFREALLKRMRPNLIVVGITNDLWLAEQFVDNLRLAFPGIAAQAISSNFVLREPDSIPVDRDTVVLAVSQSGQDFPTLGALLVLGQKLGPSSGQSLFVMTGEVDSLMGQAVGQQYAKGASFSRRIFVNESGFRPTEAAVATVSAMHHCLSELLLFLVRYGLDEEQFASPPYGLALTSVQLEELELRAKDCVNDHAPAIARSLSDGPVPTLAKQLTQQSSRWKWHIIEGVVGFLALVFVLELNLQLGLGVVPSSAVGWMTGVASAGLGHAPEWLMLGGAILGGQLDVLFYAFLVPAVVWGMRTVQRRTTLHRHGPRELLIGDTRYVHKIIWLLARKLFSLSYGFASIKPYSADPQDELVMTHEPVRGTLVLLGIPDRRRAALSARAEAALMTAKQFDASRSLGGVGAEIVAVGHAQSDVGSFMAGQISLPASDIKETGPVVDRLCDGMYDSWERLLAMAVLLNGTARSVAALGPARYDRSRTKDQVFAPTTAAPVSAASIYQLLSRSNERYEQFQHLALPFDVQRSSWRVGAESVRTTVWKREPRQKSTD